MTLYQASELGKEDAVTATEKSQLPPAMKTGAVNEDEFMAAALEMGAIHLDG